MKSLSFPTTYVLMGIRATQLSTPNIYLNSCCSSCPILIAHGAERGVVVITGDQLVQAKNEGYAMALTPNGECLYPIHNAYGKTGWCFLRRKEG